MLPQQLIKHMTNTNLSELVFLPAPGIGHFVSTMKLAKLIIDRNDTISIIILVIQVPFKSPSMLETFIECQSRDNPYPTRLIFVPLPPLPNPPDISSPTFFQTIISLYKPLVKEAIEARLQGGLSSRPVAFVHDMLCSNMIEIADELNVPSYIFFTSGVSMLNLLFHFISLIDDKRVDIIDKFSNPNIEYDVPGFEKRVNRSAIPWMYLDKDNRSKPIFNHARRWFKKSKGILVNSFNDLETYGIQTLFDQVASASLPPIYPVGPIVEPHSKSRGKFTTQDHEELTIMKWLDDQPISSVVFLCFGSMGTLDEAQVEEMAKGIENSGHRFLWSLRKTRHGDYINNNTNRHETFVEALPERFLERTNERGKVIGWAPQVSILGHPSVGGFVSHCGWNSTLESLWFGVPIATWPMYAEQQLNAFELVKELGLAVEIKMDCGPSFETKTHNVIVSAKEIENGVNKLMNMDEETSKKVKEMRDKSRKALEEGGSSYKWLGQFIQDAMHK